MPRIEMNKDIKLYFTSHQISEDTKDQYPQLLPKKTDFIDLDLDFDQEEYDGSVMVFMKLICNTNDFDELAKYHISLGNYQREELHKIFQSLANCFA